VDLVTHLFLVEYLVAGIFQIVVQFRICMEHMLLEMLAQEERNGK
jgi:hypothetical protein